MADSRDIQVIDAKTAIKKRAEMYFGSRGINPESICTSITEGALILGASKTQIAKIDDWHMIYADSDWMAVETCLKKVNEYTLFESLFGFPEWGVNAYRSEVMTKYFSDATATYSRRGFKLILGSEADLDEFEQIVSPARKWKRVIGFKFNANA